MIRRAWNRLAPSLYRRHAIVSSITSVGLFATGAISGPVLARVLGPTGRGDVAAIMAPTTVLALVLAFGVPSAAAYFVDSVPEGELLSTATLFGVLTGAPICIALYLLAPLYLSGHSPDTVSWARVFLATMPLSAGLSAALEVRRRINPGLNWNCWRSSPIVVPTVIIVLLAALGKLTLGTALAANLIGVMAPLALLVSRFQTQGERLQPSIAAFRLMFPYAWRTASTAIASSITYRLDQVVLVPMVPSADLGMYAVAVMVALLTSPLASGLSSALLGHLLGEQSETRAMARFRQALWLTLVLSSTVAVVLAVSAPVLLRLVFGARFSPATTALRLLLPGSVAFDVQSVITTKLLSEGRPGETSRGALVGAVMTVVGLVVLAPRYGINGAATVTSVAWVSQVLYLIRRGALRGYARVDPVPVVPVPATPPASSWDTTPR